MRWFRFAVLVLTASILQTTLVGVIAFWRADIKPDLLLILLVFFATHSDPREAIVASFAIGFAADLSNPVMGLMGPRILSFGLFGTLLNDLHTTISIRRMPHQAIAIFATGVLTALLSHLLTFFRAEPVAARLGAELLWQPLYSAAIGPFLFLPIAWSMHINPRRRRRNIRRREPR